MKTSKELTWIKTSPGYELALDGDKLLCKNSKGKFLKTIPKKVKELSQTKQMQEFSLWYKKHQEQAREEVERWMQLQLSIPATVIKNLWQDTLWRNALKNVVLAPVSQKKILLKKSGFLRNISSKGVGIVNLEGETKWLQSIAFVVPHPVLLPDLAEFRELASKQNIQQGILQIFREIWTVSKGIKENKGQKTYSGGYFAQLLHAIERCKSLGYKVSGGYVICPSWQNQTARFWIGASYLQEETYTGELIWVDKKGQCLQLKEVGEIAFSEGHRMAHAVFAGCNKKGKLWTPHPPVKENPYPPKKLPTLSARQLLEAGGLIEAVVKEPKNCSCDLVQISFYEHFAMPKKTFAILTATQLAKGDDLFMEHHGFKKSKVVARVAKKLKRALGFPAWVLVNDPQSAPYALDIFARLQKYAKQVNSRPGTAKKSLDSIAVELDKKAPHFLPSFYEEVARVFVKENNLKYASYAFNKAREMEKVHALNIDEKMRYKIFLEFAFLGCLSAASIKEYAKELKNVCKAEIAYKRIQRLCVERIQGGEPPFVGMGKMLDSLANSSKLRKELLLEVLEASSLSKAPLDFWKYYAKDLKSVCNDANYKACLLFLFPMKQSETKNYSFWFHLLKNTNALQLLQDKKLCQKYHIAPINWLEQAICYCVQGCYGDKDYVIPEILFEMVAKYCSVFATEKESFPLTPSFNLHYNNDKETAIEANFLDLLLELEIKIKPPCKSDRIDLYDWHKALEQKRRDLTFISQDKKFAPILKKSIQEYIEYISKAEQEEVEKLILQRPLLKQLCKKHVSQKSQKPKEAKKIEARALYKTMCYTVHLAELAAYMSPDEANIYPFLNNIWQWLETKEKDIEFANPSELNWLYLPGSLGTMAFLALSSTLKEQEREDLLGFMEEIANSPLLKYKEQIKIYSSCFHCKDSEAEKVYSKKTYLKLYKKNVYIVRCGYSWSSPINTVVLEISNGNNVTPLPHHSDICQIPLQDFWLDKKRIIDFVAHVRHIKNIEITSNHIDQFCQTTGVSQAAAIHVLHGYFRYKFFAEELQQKFNLKNEHDFLEQEMPQFSLEKINTLVSPAIESYQKLIEKPQKATQKLVEELAKSWNQLLGRRNPISIEFLAKTNKQITNFAYLGGFDLFLHLNNSITLDSYTKDGKWTLSTELYNYLSAQPEDCFGYREFECFIELILWFYIEMEIENSPYFDLALFITEIKKRLANPYLIFPWHHGNFKGYKSKKDIPATLEYINVILGKEKKQEEDKSHWHNKGVIAYLECNPDYAYFYGGFTPCKLQDDIALDKLSLVVEKSFNTKYSLDKWRLYNSPGFQDILKIMAKSPLKNGQWEMNPLNCMPEIVAKVQTKYKISQNAAQLYLQILTLTEPTKKNTIKWNNWDNAIYQKAALELVEKKIILQAKRKRAGRDFFLPGGWLDLKAPELPLEYWKLPLYKLSLNSKNKLLKPFMRIYPPKPIQQLFKEAWDKVKSGNIPK